MGKSRAEKENDAIMKKRSEVIKRKDGKWEWIQRCEEKEGKRRDDGGKGIGVCILQEREKGVEERESGGDERGK